MKYRLTLVLAVVSAISCGFSVRAANEKPVAGESASEKSSPAQTEKSEEAVPREFLEFADVSEFRGVIDDPDGYVNLRKEKRADAQVIAKVKASEPFKFKKKEGEDWCEVKLKSGVSGWMHCSRIKLYFTKDDLPPKSEKGYELMSKRAGKALIIMTSSRRRHGATRKRSRHSITLTRTALPRKSTTVLRAL